MFVVIAQHKLALIIQTEGAGCLPFEVCAVLYHKTEQDEFIVCKGDDFRGNITGQVGCFAPLPGHISPAL